MSRRTVLAGMAATGARGQSARKPNLLFLMADDHAGYVLGCDGNRRAATPNLDRLAGESVRFARHYCNSPICTPSRQSLLTGQLPHATGVTLLATALAEDRPTVATELRRAGYRTAVFGKMHFNRPGRPGLHGFEMCMTEDVADREWRKQAASREAPGGMRTKPAWKPFVDPARIWLNAEKLPYPRYYEDMKGTFLARQAESYLEERRRDGQPFALWVSFMEPHSPFDFPIEDRGRFNPAGFPPPRLGPEDRPQIPAVFEDLTEAEKSGIIAAYYTSVAYLDRNLGVVLRKLREAGMDRETLVVYTADHGYFLGQHGRFEKHNGYDPALRVPLMVRWPGRFGQRVVGSFTEHVDVPATVVDLLQIRPPGAMHGQSLRPFLEGAETRPREHVFSEYLETEQAYLRTEQFKFIYSTGRRLDWYRPSAPVEGPWRRLYDLHADPEEFHDIAAGRPELVTRFEGLLVERFRATHPDAASEPAGLGLEASLDYYLRPRDVA